MRQAEKAKKSAAAEMRRLTNRKASSEDLAKAEAAYRKAVDRLKQVKQGRPEDRGKPEIGEESARRGRTERKRRGRGGTSGREDREHTR